MGLFTDSLKGQLIRASKAISRITVFNVETHDASDTIALVNTDIYMVPPSSN